MNDQKIIIESLAMDLKRVSIGLQRGSKNMAKRFFQEALIRKSEIDQRTVPSYIRNILSKLDAKRIDEKFAEDALMYSILFQNFAQRKLT